jgi:hypothetical protein
MTVPLPIIDSGRSEFGFSRSVCACLECVRSCRHIPGYLIPADLERMQQHLHSDQTLLSWARHHLLASPGALVAQRGRPFRIPTLVPARRSDGACYFLTDENRCGVHAVAPFGCAFFDCRQPAREADQRSLRGLHAVLAAWCLGGVYAKVWLDLYDTGLRAPAPEVCRKQLREDRQAGASKDSRLSLLREVFRAVARSMESFEHDDRVGPNLAYLLGAIAAASALSLAGVNAFIHSGVAVPAALRPT